MQTANSPTSGLRGLLLLNAALLGVLAAVTLSSSNAGAQSPTRGRGEYTMVAGGVNGTDASAIYIADVANQELIAMIYNNNTHVLDGVGYRNMAKDAVDVARNRARPGSP